MNVKLLFVSLILFPPKKYIPAFIEWTLTVPSLLPVTARSRQVEIATALTGAS